MTVDQMSVDQMSVDHMYVDQMSVDQMSVDQMSVDQMSTRCLPTKGLLIRCLSIKMPVKQNACWPNSFRSKGLEPISACGISTLESHCLQIKADG
jgi:hypothetical protein